MKKIHFCLLALLATLVGARAEHGIVDASSAPPRWDKSIVKTWETVPIYDPTAARMKPLATFAKYELIRNRMMASIEIKLSDGTKRGLSATEWLLDCLFRPDFANTYPSFLVEEGEALEEVGMKVKTRRDRYSYSELTPYRDRIDARAEEIDRKSSEHKQRTGETLKLDPRDEEMSDLATNLKQYDMLIGALEPFRNGLPVSAVPGLELPEGVTGGQRLTITQALDILAKNTPWTTMLQSMKAQSGGSNNPLDYIQPVVSILAQNKELSNKIPKNALDRKQLLAVVEEHMESLQKNGALVKDSAIVHSLMPQLFWAFTSSGRLLLVHGNDDKGEWTSFGKLAGDALLDPAALEKNRAQLAQLEALKSASNDADLQALVKVIGEDLAATGASLPHYGDIKMELAYVKLDPFSWAKWLFLLVFILTSISWIHPTGSFASVVYKIAKWGVWIPWALILGGIIMRVLIVKWGPVTTIYETMPFIALVGVFLAIILELIFKNRIPLALAAFMGCTILWMAELWETTRDQADTMKNMEAVLRSRFWLWTHVTTINMGYATVFVAALLSSVYIFLRLFDIGRHKKDLFKMLTSSSYGILCFGLLVSLVGTILGGIWGNESWGRFWGWDPKENGALIIVLWCLATLHMRLAGWIREIGLHICNTIGACFVIFSWFHVNQLGIGLHSYGWTSGIMFWILVSYAVFGSIALIGFFTSIACKLETHRRKVHAEELRSATPSVS